MSILIFFLVLFVLILVHELGHFMIAKWVGMRVDEFGIGFPPKLWGMKKGETEYTFNALPIGGFVRILGENFDEEEVRDDYERSFVAKSKWAQAAVLVAGVTMNVLFAWLLITVVFMAGVTTSVEESAAGPNAHLRVAEVLTDAPAADAGLAAGATITMVQSGEEELTSLTPSAFSSFVTEHGTEPITIEYSYKGEASSVTITPEPGVIESEPDTPAVGVALAMTQVEHKAPVTAMVSAAKTTGSALVAITTGIGGLIADAVRFQADFSSVAGPVGIVGMVGEAAGFGITSLLMFTAFISLNLAVINLLPFPALDGGRLLFVAIEAVIRRPLNPVWLARLNFAGFALLILLMVAVTYSDVVKLL